MRFLGYLSAVHLFFLFGFQSNGGSIVVQLDQLKNSEGYVLLSLYNMAEGFPSDSQKAIAYGKVRVNNKKASFTFRNLPMGTYAVAVLHDENGNGKLDTNLFGIPREDYGASNNPKSTFAPPTFQDAKFEVEGQTAIRIEMRGLLR